MRRPWRQPYRAAGFRELGIGHSPNLDLATAQLHPLLLGKSLADILIQFACRII